MQKLNLELQWGGIYISRNPEDSTYGIFRILDFNRDAYHIAIYQEKFTTPPSLTEILKLKPFIGHAPMALSALMINDELQLVGGQELSKEDLEGYNYYLEAHDVELSEIEDLTQRLIGFSKEPPMQLSLAKQGDSIEILETE
ncbi:hypothetical protein [Cerasicoccus maritimus]|uniref:hypothetical protein n=1 Tax=Cerasicoccus maritimus TaxID=490089 RepID=UPI0028528A8A|nr:hypothetical protein [Cerasicoccus maritimus]